ncbi:hypothetical protein C9994_00255 [Marivirga lumbricoides]|uniref:Uncharacterized protein n=1 Tax=Marivirga lumbricoides TaxID=1046115 RepID=A0A2T4DW39_9BACT|nr:hypothetical protein C9994_00255 [Marivirga lumbricoides]
MSLLFIKEALKIKNALLAISSRTEPVEVNQGNTSKKGYGKFGRLFVLAAFNGKSVSIYAHFRAIKFWKWGRFIMSDFCFYTIM